MDYSLSFTITCTIAAEALAAQVTQENYDKGLIYPPFTNIRKISAHIAANVAAKAYELGKTCSILRTHEHICFFSLLLLNFHFGV